MRAVISPWRRCVLVLRKTYHRPHKGFHLSAVALVVLVVLVGVAVVFAVREVALVVLAVAGIKDRVGRTKGQTLLFPNNDL